MINKDELLIQKKSIRRIKTNDKDLTLEKLSKHIDANHPLKIIRKDYEKQ